MRTREELKEEALAIWNSGQEKYYFPYGIGDLLRYHRKKIFFINSYITEHLEIQRRFKKNETVA